MSRLILEVDQSSKIETAHDTILAYSNHLHYAICIPAQVKREMLAHLRARGRSKARAVIWLFAAGLFLLLRDIIEQVSQVTIDLEYAGHEADIRSMLLRFADLNGLNLGAEAINFAAVGKVSNAHELAISVFRGRLKADRTVTLPELMAMVGEKTHDRGELDAAPLACTPALVPGIHASHPIWYQYSTKEEGLSSFNFTPLCVD
jgi:hypothetical protein